MSKPILDEFAQVLVREVRDAAIRSCDANVRDDANNAIAIRWRQAATGTTGEVLLRAVIPDVVDATVAHLLGAIDQETLHLFFASKTGERFDLTNDGQGELSGWYKGTEGWCARFAEERFVDDVADLSDFFAKRK